MGLPLANTADADDFVADDAVAADDDDDDVTVTWRLARELTVPSSLALVSSILSLLCLIVSLLDMVLAMTSRSMIHESSWRWNGACSQTSSSSTAAGPRSFTGRTPFPCLALPQPGLAPARQPSYGERETERCKEREELELDDSQMETHV